MTFKLGTSIKVGHKIMLATGWCTVLEVTDKGAKTDCCFVAFGDVVLGWKSA